MCLRSTLVVVVVSVVAMVGASTSALAPAHPIRSQARPGGRALILPRFERARLRPPRWPSLPPDDESEAAPKQAAPTEAASTEAAAPSSPDAECEPVSSAPTGEPSGIATDGAAESDSSGASAADAAPLSEPRSEPSPAPGSSASLSLALIIAIGVWVVLFAAIAWGLAHAHSRVRDDDPRAEFAVPIPNSFYKSYTADAVRLSSGR